MGDSNLHLRQAESRRLPTGTVVFLFTDVEGSTRRWESDPEKMSRALQLHDETLRSAIELRGGYVFKTVGDGVCAAFDRLTDAASAAETIVEQLSSDAFKDVGTLGVRIAIHMGEAYERDGDYFGPTVNRIARLLQIVHPGQIILSAAAAESLRLYLPPNISLKYLEEHRLKDLARPERVFQLLAPGICADFPPLRSLGTIAENNLPLQPSELIGRESVVGEVRTLLKTHRLVTLTGSGGIGKTRVSLQVAAELLDEFTDGVWFVDLAPITDAALVASMVSNVLQLDSSKSNAPLEALLIHLEQRQILIVLDNCEHVITEAAKLSEALLQRCGKVHLLATSREALNISGESVYWIPSLDVPSLQSGISASKALSYGAVMLFVERAHSANARFMMTDENAPLVCEICHRLDGIALAIELAAARTTLFPPRELARQLDKRFAVLTGGRRTVLRRQQTLRAAIDWSYELLDETEKRLFTRLAVFVNGWTSESVDVVCADDVLPVSVISETLSSLVQKSLVIVDLHADRNRFRFLESTRLYALERLENGSERLSIAQAHLCWILELSEDAMRMRGKVPLAQWLSRIEPETENIREALRFADSVEIQPLIAARIVGALATFWFVAGLLHEGRKRIEAALSKLDEQNDGAIVARLSLGFAQLSASASGRDSALRAIAIFCRLGDWRGHARAEGTLASILGQIGDMKEAEMIVGRCLSIWRQHGDTHSYDYACDLDTSGTIYMSTGHHERARVAYEEAATIFVSLGEEEGAAISRFNLAELEFSLGRAQRALTLSMEAIASLRKLKSLGRLVIALTNAAGYQRAVGDLSGSQATAREVLYLGRRFQIEAIPSAIEHLAAVDAISGNCRRAARLLGYVQACYQQTLFERGPTESASFEAISKALAVVFTKSQIESLLAEGALLSESRAIDEALID